MPCIAGKHGTGGAYNENRGLWRCEYQVKAAFTCQCIAFVSGWKFEQESEQNGDYASNDDRPIRIGIVGEDLFKDAFAPLVNRKARGRQVQVRRFPGFSELDYSDSSEERLVQSEEIKTCDLVFVAASERSHLNAILKPLRNEPILTIADTPGFLERGGIINFATVGRHIKFEINTADVRRAKRDMRSRLLRLATRVIDEDDVEG